MTPDYFLAPKWDPEVYHTRPDCPAMWRSEAQPASEEDIAGLRECDRCSGRQNHSLHQQLDKMEADAL